MSRGLLDDSTLQQIAQNLPDLTTLVSMVRALPPDHLSVKFPHDSNIPVAAVCLQDMVDALEDAHYALHEVYAHQIWYREKRETPIERAAVYYGRFYAQDLAFRLYSAAEHLANGIIMMLEITDPELEPYRRKARVSQASVLGHYLLKERKDHLITQIIRPLATLRAWQQTTSYRNQCVHAQPPTVAGLGRVYKRERRWKTLEPEHDRVKQHVLGLGNGDMPEYALEDILKFLEPAFFTLVAVTQSVAEFYVTLLSQHGINATPKGLTYKL